jgi:hypothetical protein
MNESSHWSKGSPAEAFGSSTGGSGSLAQSSGNLDELSDLFPTVNRTRSIFQVLENLPCSKRVRLLCAVKTSSEADADDGWDDF